MEEQRISFETAILAKDKGYDIVEYNHAFNPNTGYKLEGHVVTSLLYAEPDLSKHLFRPTQSLLQKWLREVHDIDVIINTLRNQGNKDYQTHISSLKETTKGEYYHKTYEEALEVGLQEALKLL